MQLSLFYKLTSALTLLLILGLVILNVEKLQRIFKYLLFQDTRHRLL